MEFKEGQEVRVKPHGYFCRRIKEGIIYELKLRTNGCLYVGDRSNLYAWCECYGYWQLASEDPYENLKVGDWLVHKDGDYKLVLVDLGGERGLHTYVLSCHASDKEDNRTKCADNSWTVFEMKEKKWIPENSTP